MPQLVDVGLDEPGGYTAVLLQGEQIGVHGHQRPRVFHRQNQLQIILGRDVLRQAAAEGYDVPGFILDWIRAISAPTIMVDMDRPLRLSLIVCSS